MMAIHKKHRFLSSLILAALGFWLLALAGCVTAPAAKKTPAAMTGIGKVRYHKVARGQTLWRIARANGIDVEELARLNQISDSSKLEVGQQLAIPDTNTAGSVPAADDEDFMWPLKGSVIAHFRSAAASGGNPGLDIAPRQVTEVVASRSGKVVFLDADFIDLGKTVILEHPDGFWTVYGRNAEVYVALGESVQRGAVIAKAGQAGRDKATYLHFEIRKSNRPVNPLFYLP